MSLRELSTDKVLMWTDHLCNVLEDCDWSKVNECIQYADVHHDKIIEGDDDYFYNELYHYLSPICETAYPTQDIEDALLPEWENGDDDEVWLMYSVLEGHPEYDLIKRALKLVLELGW